MAKARRLRVSKLEGAGVEAARFTSATLLHPDTIQLNKRGVAQAHAKHEHDYAPQGPAPLSLADRFHALPAELRAEIFCHLLVQPVKWEIDHDSSCHLYKYPSVDIRPAITSCARCASSWHFLHWRMSTTRNGGWRGAWVNPWRSKYAPEVMNEFMCTDCWDESFRVEVVGVQFPKRNKDMPCLCARRTNLDILLVCRQWYSEASRVLWASNTFAFESCDLFTSFATACPARDKVTKISVLDPGRHHPPQPYGPFGWPDSAYHKKRQAAIAALRKFPALTHLELDSCFLRDARDVQVLLRVGLRGLKSVRFVYHEVAKRVSSRVTPMAPAVAKSKDDSHRIYPVVEKRILLRGGLAEEVARAMKGEHRAWTKHRDTAEDKPKSNKARSKRQKPGVSLIKTAVERHIAFEQSLKTAGVPAHRIVNCDDAEVWERLWWKVGGRLHWSQSYLSVDWELYEPHGWSKGIRVDEQRAWREVFPFVDWDLTGWTWEEEFPFAGMRL